MKYFNSSPVFAEQLARVDSLDRDRPTQVRVLSVTNMEGIGDLGTRDKYGTRGIHRPRDALEITNKNARGTFGKYH